MARKKNGYSVMKKRNKIQPAAMTLTLSSRSVEAGTVNRSYIDLSQVASIVNRRFYRQGINWAVAGFKFQALGPGTIQVCKLPNTWVTSNSWEKAFRMWNKQQMEAVDDAGAQSTVAKFRDFKVFMEVNHVEDFIANGEDLNATNLLPIASTAVAGTPVPVLSAGGEWQPSQIVIPNELPDASGTEIDPSEYVLHMVGTNSHPIFSPNFEGSKGVLEGYADSRAYPQSPDPVSPSPASANNWMRLMFDVGNDNADVLANVSDRNDELPYPQVDYPGGQNQLKGLEIHDLVNIYATSGTTNIGSVRAKGGNFPCGLIAVDWSPQDSSGYLQIQVDLVPGNHRGYLCEPMTEM
ncbi:MAG: putative capsid protein [Circoviridae sp.]|nr:MAG: putative capsid protein [Circoviridae sp.]